MPPRDVRSKDQLKPASVKTTRSKTERSSKNTPTEAFAGPSNPSPSASERKSSPARSKSGADGKAPGNSIPIVDFRAEVSPGRAITKMPTKRSEKSSIALKAKNHPHGRSSAFPVENADGVAKGASSGSPSRSTQRSNASKKTQTVCRSETPASETNYDNASITDSIADSNNINDAPIKRKETERKQYFENESECGSIEPHRAFCTRCKKWVRLSARQAYCVKPWEAHRAKCDKNIPIKPAYKNLGLVAKLPFIVPRTEKLRKALLEIDDTAEKVEPEQIKCKTCQQWVALETRYELQSWTTHKSACRNNLNPLDIEKTLERKLFFLCDAQFKRFTNSNIVECAICNCTVKLNSDVEYDLEKWLAHKKSCHINTQQNSHELAGVNDPLLSNTHPETQPRTETIITPILADFEPHPDASGSQSQPTSSSDSGLRPGHTSTLSTTDSDRTLVPASSSISALPSSTSITAPSHSSSLQATILPSSSLKRKRDILDAEDTDMSGERPTSRQRTEDHISGNNGIASGLGMFLLPFKAFAKGFKESLTNVDS